MLQRDENNALRLKNEGNVFFGKKEYRLAIGCYHQATIANSECKEAWFNKSLSHSALQETREALEALTKAIQIDSCYTKAVYNKVKLLATLECYELAIETIDRYFANDGEDHTIVLLRKEIAQKCVRQSLGMDAPLTTEALMSLGQLHQKLKEYEVAKKYFQAVITLEPEHSEARKQVFKLTVSLYDGRFSTQSPTASISQMMMGNSPAEEQRQINQALRVREKQPSIPSRKKALLDDYQNGAEQQNKTDSLSEQLYKAIQSGNCVRLEKVLQAGANPNTLLMTGYFPHFMTHTTHERANPLGADSILRFALANPDFGEYPLYLASRLGHVSLVDCLLRYGAEVNRKDNYGLTALTVAITEGRLQVARRLLAEPQLIIDHPIQDGSTALLFACEKGNEEIVQALIQKGANINHADNDGETPLMSSQIHKNQGMTTILLVAGANPNQCKPNGVTPLFFAAQDNQLVSLKQLIRYGADLEISRKTDRMVPLMIAACNGHTESVFYLLACGADPRKHCQNQLRAADYARINNHFSLFKQLSDYQKNRIHCVAQFEKGVDLFNKRALQAAIDVFQALAKTYLELYYQQASVDLASIFCELSACYLALGQPEKADFYHKKQEEIIRTLFGKTHKGIQASCCLQSNNVTQNAPDNVDKLKHRMSSLQLKNLLANASGSLEKALVISVMTGSLDEVSVLLENGANPHVNVADYFPNITHERCPVIFLAAQKGYEPIVSRLLAAGVDNNSKIRTGKTPLTLVIQKRQALIEALRAAMIINPDVNQRLDSEHHTPLILAVKLGAYDLATSLVNDGAELWLEDIYENHAFDLCSNEGREQLLAASKKRNQERKDTEYCERLSGNNETNNKVDLWNTQFTGLKSYKLIKAALALPCDLEKRNPKGDTPLLAAVRAKGNQKIALLLIKAGADLEARDKNGRNVREIIQGKKGFPPAVYKQIEIALSEAAKMKKLKKSLTVSVTEGYYNLAQYAISQGENLNQLIGNNRETLLMRAIRNKHLDIAKLLIANKTDITLKNKQGETAAEITKKMTLSETERKIVGILLGTGNTMNISPQNNHSFRFFSNNSQEFSPTSDTNTTEFRIAAGQSNHENFREPQQNFQPSQFYLEAYKAALLYGENREDFLPEQNDNRFISSEDSLKIEAAKNGYVCENVPGDGNCFYQVVARQLNTVLSLNFTLDQAQQLGKCLRKLACEHIEQHWKIYEAFLDDSFELKEQAKDKIWVEDIAITALCHALNINLICVRSDEAEPTIKRLEKGVCTLYIGYQVGLHYQSLSPLTTDSDKHKQNALKRKFDDTTVSQLQTFTVITETDLKIMLQNLLLTPQTKIQINQALFNELKRFQEKISDEEAIQKTVWESLEIRDDKMQNQTNWVTDVNAPKSDTKLTTEYLESSNLLIQEIQIKSKDVAVSSAAGSSSDNPDIAALIAVGFHKAPPVKTEKEEETALSKIEMTG